MSLSLGSDAFTQGGAIPTCFTCDDQDISPQLLWQDVPADAKSLVLIVDDPDAPDPQAPKMTWVHWLLYNIPASATGLSEGIQDAELPQGSLQGLNDWKRTGYGGPCPPIGRHRYFFKLYALDVVLTDLDKPAKPKVVEAMQGHILAQSELMGTYIRLS